MKWHQDLIKKTLFPRLNSLVIFNDFFAFAFFCILLFISICQRKAYIYFFVPCAIIFLTIAKFELTKYYENQNKYVNNAIVSYNMQQRYFHPSGFCHIYIEEVKNM